MVISHFFLSIDMLQYENNIVHDRGLTEKTTYYMSPFIESIQNRQIYIDRQICGCVGLGREVEVVGRGTGSERQ